MPNPDLEGHRGCRGLMPENTIPAFIKALDLNVTTLEMDAVISKDSEVVISHDTYMNHLFCLTPTGDSIPAPTEQDYKIFQMPYSQVKQYDCGSKSYPAFPHQAHFKTYKPLLSEVIDSCEAHAKATGRTLPWYNIETKSTPEGDGIDHPDPETFANLVWKVIKKGGIASRTIVQSFDPRTLEVLHKENVPVKYSLLVENTKSLDENLASLSFKPDIYSPDSHVVTPELVQDCHAKGILVVPWTVDKLDEMQHLMNMGVDGLISDYPNLYEKLN